MIAVLSDKIIALQNSTTERFAEQTENIAELKTFTMEKFSEQTEKIAELKTFAVEKFAALEAKIANGQRDMIKWAATLFVGMIVVFSIVVDHIVDNSIKSHLASERATMQEMQATVQDMQVTMQDMQATMQQLVDEREEP